jgi:glycerol-3-phosphate dehydrogenase
MQRDRELDRLRQETKPWDFIIIGGGATGLGAAVDAASRGYRTLLVEQDDFAKGTSSRSTKLLHGGVRYLKQGNVSLVFDALRERSLICRNAPHLASRLGFVIPAYKWHERSFYGLGMEVYDRMAGKLSLGRSQWLSRAQTLERLPTLQRDQVRGGILYYDGQFDDSRMAVNLAQTAVERGAVVLNYMQAVGLMQEAGRIAGVRLRDIEGAADLEVRGACVINATGVFCDSVRAMESPDVRPLLVASQGTHLVLPREFLPGDDALMIPKTADGRVLFALPWHDRVVLGTTDVQVDETGMEPRATEDEIQFLLEHAGKYLTKAPRPDEVLSIFSGLRPLVSIRGQGKGTSTLSRDHTIAISEAGLVSITGGKWTTYRKMAADVIDRAEEAKGLPHRACVTRDLKLHGWLEQAGSSNGLSIYGSDAQQVKALAAAIPGGQERIHPRLPCLKAEVVWAVRQEMARTVEDVLSRRSRSLLLDARASMEAAPEVARLMAAELGRDEIWQQSQVEVYGKVARGYLLP